MTPRIDMNSMLPTENLRSLSLANPKRTVRTRRLTQTAVPSRFSSWLTVRQYGTSLPGIPRERYRLIISLSFKTIRSIVNGLRDDDAESLYMNRASFVSDYSYRDPGEGVQLFIKEHARKGSKDSTSSFLSRRKTQQQAPRRPETKVGFALSVPVSRV